MDSGKTSRTLQIDRIGAQVSRLKQWIEARKSQPLNWLWTVVLVNIVWRVARYGLRFPLWGDEAMLSINFVTRDWWQLLKPLEYIQVAPIGFLWLEKAVVEGFGESEYAVRGPAFGLGLATLPVVWMCARQLVCRRAVLLSLAIFASSYYPVRHAAEVKPYASDLFFSALLLLIGWKVVENPRSILKWTVLAVTGCVAIWSSYPAAFVAGGIQVVLVWPTLQNRDYRAIFAWFLSGSMLALSLFFSVSEVGQQQAESANKLVDSDMWRDTFLPIDRPWEIPWWLIKIHTGRMLAYPFGGRTFGSTLTFLMVVCGGSALWQKSRRGKQIVLYLLAPAAFAVIASALKKYPYGGSARTSLFLAPSICLLAGEGCRIFTGWIRKSVPVRTSTNIICVASVVIALVGLGRDVIHPYKTQADQTLRTVIMTLMADVREGDVIVIENAALSSRQLPYTLHGAGLTLGNFGYYLETLSSVPVIWGESADQLPEVRGNIWLILHDTKNAPLNPQFLSKFEAGYAERYGDGLIQREEVDENEFVRIRVFGSNSVVVSPDVQITNPR